MSPSKIKKILGDSILEQGRFGRTDTQAIWIEAKSLRAVAEKLKLDPELTFNWLENLSAMEMDGNIVLSYFLRSHQTAEQVVIRVSLAPASLQAKVTVSSVCAFWAMAEMFEAEIEDLFGVQFKDGVLDRTVTTGFQLAPGSEGFPLRKSFRFAKTQNTEVSS